MLTKEKRKRLFFLNKVIINYNSILYPSIVESFIDEYFKILNIEL